MKITKGMIFLIVVLVGLMLYAGYLLSNKEENPSLSQEEEKKNSVTIPEVTDGYKKYYKGSQAIGAAGDYEIYKTVDIRIPKIISEKENAKKLNKMMIEENVNESELDQTINDIRNNRPSNVLTKISYDYIAKSNILIMILEKQIGTDANAGTSYSLINYFYDVENDKILTMKETLDKLGYDKTKIIDEINQERKSIGMALLDETTLNKSIYELLKSEPYAGVRIDANNNLKVTYLYDLGL